MDYLHSLICKHASFDMLRKAEQVIALCEIQNYLEDDCIGQAISRYEAWQKAFPEGIDSEQTPITLQEVCRIPDADFCSMPWIYANVLQTLCADEVEPEDGEITAQTELKYLSERSQATWIWNNNSAYHSFETAYTKCMETEWINEFITKMEILWPLTSKWHSQKEYSTNIVGEIIWPQGYNNLHELNEVLEGHDITDDITAIVHTGDMTGHYIDDTHEQYEHLEMLAEPHEPHEPLAEPHKPLAKKKVRGAEPFWPFMRCKNVYKAYGGKGRLSHHDLLIWLADKFKMSVETLKKTDPYTINGIKGIPRGYWSK